MRAVPRSRIEIIQAAHPNARIEFTDQGEVIVIPTYDIDSDTQGQIILKIIEDVEPGRKPQPGDTMTDMKTGATFKIIDPMSLIPIRKGPISDEC